MPSCQSKTFAIAIAETDGQVHDLLAASSVLLKLENSVEVALALKVVLYFQVKFSVRSAGHNANPGFGSIDGSGILLDLGSRNSIELSDEKKIVSVGPIAKRDRIYDDLDKHGLTAVGGRIAGVGVGGLVLGGESLRNNENLKTAD